MVPASTSSISRKAAAGGEAESTPWGVPVLRWWEKQDLGDLWT